MPIEFRCTQCDRLLRVPDGTSGKDAKCPQCGAILKIPEAAAPVPPAPPSAAVPPPFRETMAYDPQNPYQSPTAGREFAPSAFRPTRIDFTETFSRTWELYKRNLGGCIAGTLLMVVCQFIVGFVLAIPFGIAQANLDGAPQVAVMILQQLVSQAVGAFFWIGLIIFMLKIARTEVADFAALFSGGPYFLYAVVLYFIITIAMTIGFFLLIIPMFIIGLMFSQTMYMLVDQRSDIVGSLRLSMQATDGNKLTLLAIYLVAGLGGLLFSIVTCCIGYFFAVPFLMLLWTVAYLGMTGQPTALDGLAQQPMVERPLGGPGAQPAI
jgi:hypothetical protein